MSITRAIGFIGAGKMASALALGFVKGGTVSPKNVVLYDPFPSALEGLAARGFRIANSNEQVVSEADVIFLAVKPQVAPSLLPTLKPSRSKLLVSIVAGLPISAMRKHGLERVIRVMPNTPCLVNQSASAFCASPGVSLEDKNTIRTLLSAVGVCHEVLETQMSAVTAISGSAPAYVYMMIEAMMDAGIKAGLSKDVALELAAKTVVGAGTMVLETGEHPALLKNDVCSPGGTTICAVEELEHFGFRNAVMKAMNAVRVKSDDLAKLA